MEARQPAKWLLAGHVCCLGSLLMGCTMARPALQPTWQHDPQRQQWTIQSQQLQVAVAATAGGLVDGSICLINNDRKIVIGGVQIRTLGTERTSPQAVQYEQHADELLVHHDFGDGITVTATLTPAAAGPLLRCQLEPTSQIEMIYSGALDQPLESLAVDYGWLIKHPGPFSRPRLMTNFFLGRTPDGSAVLVGCDQTARLVVDPAQRTYSLRAMYRTASVTYWFGLAPEWTDLIDAYRRATNPRPGQRAEQLVGRLVLDDWSASPYDHLIPLLDALHFAGADRLVVVRHNWQHYGYDVKLPDVFPPNPQFGSLQQLADFATLCKTRQIAFGLHDNVSDLYLDAPSFSQCQQAFQPGEWHRGQQRPWLGWYNRHTGQQAVRHAPNSALRMIRRNVDLVRQAMPVSTAFLDVTSYCTPPPIETPDGQFIAPDQVLQTERQMYAETAETVEGPVLGEGCTENFLGVVDGANCDLWNVNRWGTNVPCQDWEYFPLLDWLAHDCVVLQGAGYPGRFNQPDAGPIEPAHYQPPLIDDYRSASLLCGHAPLYFIINTDFARPLPQVAREYYLGVPFHEHVGLERILDVRHEPDDIHRLTVRYANETVVHVNRGHEPWTVAGWTLPQFGVLVRGQDFFQATALWLNNVIDVVTKPALLFFDMRGVSRTWMGITTAGMLVVHKRPETLEIVPLANIDSLEIDLARLLFDHTQVSRITLLAPDGHEQPLDYGGEGVLKLDAKALELPPTNDDFTPRYRKILLVLAPQS